MLQFTTIARLNKARAKRQAGYGRPAIVLTPNPRYAVNRARQLSPERREQFLRAVGMIGQ